MIRAYSQDLRDRVLGASAEGSSARQIAARGGLGVSTDIVWIRRERVSGVRSALLRRQPKESILNIHANVLLRLVAETPDITLHEMQFKLKDCLEASASIAMIRNSSTAGRSSLKKAAHAAEQERSDVLEAREI
jgi:transposase